MLAQVDSSFNVWAAETPDAIALRTPGREPLTYAGLGDHVRTTRRLLRDVGLQPREPAALLLRGPELITAFLAVAGESAAAPLNPTLTEDEYHFYLSRLGARILLIQDDLAAPAVAARRLGIRLLRVRTAPDFAAGVFTLEPEDPLPRTPVRQTEASLLLFTSATTGSPKLIPLTGDNLRAMVLDEQQALQLSQADRFLSLTPLFHLAGLGSALTQLSCGGSVISTGGFDPETFESLLDHYQPTWFKSSPPLNSAILALARVRLEHLRCPALRFVLTSGAASEPEVLASLEEALGVAVLNAYGLTETGGIARNTPSCRKPGSAGQSKGIEVALMDESGALLPPNQVGEVVVRGPALMSGYLDDPLANETAFRNGWFRTGDLGHLDSEGFLFITGRLKEIINRGGQKIMPSEVDRFLATHPAVADAAAFPIQHATLGEDLAAAVVLQPGASVSESDLRQFLVAHLAPFKIPRRIIFLDALPRVATGKLGRSALTEQFCNLAGESPESLRSPDTTEARLIEIWRLVLNVQSVALDDDFFQLGGDSLSAAVMLTQVQRELNAGRDLPNRADFFKQPTVGALAQILSNFSLNGHSSNHPILPLQRCGSRASFFCFAPDYLDPYYLRYLSKSLGRDQPFYVVCPPEPVRDRRMLKVEELAGLLVAAIQATRPQGPYLLGGHCYGGVVAFEAAQQLLSRGEEVTRLVLFDVPTPGYPKVVRNWRRYLAESRRMLTAAARGGAQAQAAEAIRHARRLTRIVQRRFSGRAVRAMASLGTPAPAAPHNAKQLTAFALWEYVPRDFPAPIIHFLAADEQVSTKVLDDPRWGWRDFARGGLQVFTSPGSHGSMLDSQNAPALAAQLEPLLRPRSLAART